MPAVGERERRRLRVLVACEFSGTVRDAFSRRGWEAWSCDLLPSEKPGNHIQGDVLPLLGPEYGWDLVIAHPPCTYLTNAGNAYLGRPGRVESLREAAAFFMEILGCGAPHVAVENPVMTRIAKELCGKPDQKVHPYHFGHAEFKGTCFWLRNLPPLEPTTDLLDETLKRPKREREANRWIHQTKAGDRWKKRSLTYPGIAQAMADQWGRFVELRNGRV